MRLLLSLITLVSCYSCSQNNTSQELVDYMFLDTITLTDYYVSIPECQDCPEIKNTNTLLSCFPELVDVIDKIRSMSEDDFESLKLNPEEYANYGPTRWHLYNLSVFTNINAQGLEIRYSLNPKGGTIQIDKGKLMNRCNSEEMKKKSQLNL